jgi:hypothetical protein
MAPSAIHLKKVIRLGLHFTANKNFVAQAVGIMTVYQRTKRY